MPDTNLGAESIVVGQKKLLTWVLLGNSDNHIKKKKNIYIYIYSIYSIYLKNIIIYLIYTITFL